MPFIWTEESLVESFSWFRPAPINAIGSGWLDPPAEVSWRARLARVVPCKRGSIESHKVAASITARLSIHLSWLLHCSFSSSVIKRVVGFRFVSSHSIHKARTVIGCHVRFAVDSQFLVSISLTEDAVWLWQHRQKRNSKIAACARFVRLHTGRRCYRTWNTLAGAYSPSCPVKGAPHRCCSWLGKAQHQFLSFTINFSKQNECPVKRALPQADLRLQEAKRLFRWAKRKGQEGRRTGNNIVVRRNNAMLQRKRCSCSDGVRRNRKGVSVHRRCQCSACGVAFEKTKRGKVNLDLILGETELVRDATPSGQPSRAWSMVFLRDGGFRS